MVVSRSGASLADIFTGFKLNFNKGFDGAKSTISVVAMEVPSTASEENYAWLGSFPMIREWVGDRIVTNLSAWKYAIRNKNFESTVRVPGNEMEDDQYGLFAPLMLEMGREAAIHPDRMAYNLLNTGFASPCYDDQNFFDTDHPVEDTNGQTTMVSNMQAGSGPAWFLIDASRQLRPLVHQKRRPYRFVSLDKPNDNNVFWQNEYIYGCDGRSNVGFGLWQLAFGSKADLTHENYEAARAAMASLTRDGGYKLGVAPTHLVVPQELEGAARRIVKNATRVITVGTAPDTSDVVISNEWQDTAELLISAYL
ncbi:Mu-like prophage major head subunit gpT family protein [Magnetospirillum sp. 15-1]|uniref:Mu-like prophage major head subunit gpT family protein n=1 Tax=Magnetospirillum sp. 15-1 TaxID=1979370 RepID=UPI000BBC0F8C|nr:Mu-like prophage major head subunit gpT family protein [Magnetospirillum sp. 15-1]